MRRALAAALLLGCCATSSAREFPGILRTEPLIVQLAGRFAADRAAALAASRDVVSVQLGDALRWLAVTRVRTVGGDPTLGGRDVLNLVAPIHPNLFAVGSEDLRHQLADTPDGTPVEFEGLLSRGSRTLLLRTVRVGS